MTVLQSGMHFLRAIGVSESVEGSDGQLIKSDRVVTKTDNTWVKILHAVRVVILKTEERNSKGTAILSFIRNSRSELWDGSPGMTSGR